MTALPPMSHRLTIELRRLVFEHYDNCMECGYKFKEADRFYWGYNSAGAPLYVCARCEHLLEELARRQYFTPHPYKVPKPRSQLWRYMDFTKFVSLLSTKSLYFPSAACFTDIHEGAKGLRKHKPLWDEFYLEENRQSIRSSPHYLRQPYSEEEVERRAVHHLQDLEAGGEELRHQTFISCWHENAHESEAMWKLYSAFEDYAIAIRTSYDRLYKSLGRNPDINIGRVQYVDLNTHFVQINDAFWRKRKSFQHEREVRAVIWNPDYSGTGLSMPCDVGKLVAQIVVSPKAPAWFVALVEDVSHQYGFDLPVQHSSLIQDTFF
jgi:hypothetical protein